MVKRVELLRIKKAFQYIIADVKITSYNIFGKEKMIIAKYSIEYEIKSNKILFGPTWINIETAKVLDLYLGEALEKQVIETMIESLNW